jgi:hypothetical protein
VFADTQHGTDHTAERGTYIASPRKNPNCTQVKPFNLSVSTPNTPRSASACPASGGTTPDSAAGHWSSPRGRPRLKAEDPSDPLSNTLARAKQRALSAGSERRVRPFFLSSVLRHEQCAERRKSLESVELKAEAKQHEFKARPFSRHVCLVSLLCFSVSCLHQ